MAKGNAVDLTGRKFGFLTVIEKAPSRQRAGSGQTIAQWKCKCVCGTEKIVAASDLLKGTTKSCGCKRRRAFSKRPNRRRFCTFDLSGDYGIGFTHNTGVPFYFDLEDYEKIKGYCWSEHKLDSGYRAIEAWDSDLQQVIRLPWVIVGKNYDHINRDPTDNRKSNLRPATALENAANHSKQKSNKSAIIGVHWNKKEKKWVAALRKNGRTMFAKSYSDFEDAVVVRLLGELAYFGEFAPQKHLLEEYGLSGGQYGNNLLGQCELHECTAGGDGGV